MDHPRRDLRFLAIKACLALGFAAALLIAPALWSGPRSLPRGPVLDILPLLPAPLETALHHGLLALLLAVTVIPDRPRLLLAAAGLIFGLSMFDQARWHAWCYQYFFSFAILGFYPVGSGKGEEERRAQVLDALRLLLVCTYVWSGLHKLNFSFVHDVYPWMIGPTLGLLPEALHPPLKAAALAVPLVEAALGLALLFPRTRRAGVILLTGMHLFILFSLGPILGGNDWNHVVWPWNIVMILLDFLLFWNDRTVGWRDIVVPREIHGHRLTLLLFGFMPALNFAGLWPDYLSISLYSGKGPLAAFHLHEPVFRQLPETVRARTVDLGEGCHELDIVWWAVTDLNVPAYPSTAYFLKIHRRMSVDFEKGHDATIAVRLSEPPHLVTGLRRVSWHGAVGCPRIVPPPPQ